MIQTNKEKEKLKMVNIMQQKIPKKFLTLTT